MGDRGVLARAAGDEADGYARLAFGGAGRRERSASAQEALVALAGARVVGDTCERCHGSDGQGRERAAFPRLAGQRREYLMLALQAYAAGSRHSGIMAPVAAGLQAGTMSDVAEYYAGLPPPVGSVTSGSTSRGAEIAARGIPRSGCPRARSATVRRRIPSIPRIQD